MFTGARKKNNKKKKGNGIAADCQLFYLKIYGYFCSVSTNCAAPSKMNVKRLGRCYFEAEAVYFPIFSKTDKHFKNTSSRVSKISAFHKRIVKSQIFSRHSMKYITYSLKKSKYAICIRIRRINVDIPLFSLNRNRNQNLKNK